MKKYLITGLKFALAAAIIGWLLTTVDAEQLTKLRERPKNWGLLGLAFALCFTGVSITFVRWWLLVRSLDMPFRLRDAFRLGFLGYLLNFVSIGLVGGDLFKAVFIAREQPGRRTEAIATVLIDRLMGLYALLVVTSLAIVLGGLAQRSPSVAAICHSTLWATGVGAACIATGMLPGVTSERVMTALERLPLVGGVAARMLSAVRIYRSRPLVLVLAGGLSLAVHTMLAGGVFLAATAIFPSPPSLSEHCMIVPLSMVAGALPFTPAGLGTFEVAMEQLYSLVPAKPCGDGVIVALTYRMITIAIAGFGGLVYVSSRREVRELLEDAERPQPEDRKAALTGPVETV